MTTQSRDETQIRTLLEERAAALRAKDAPAVLSHYAPDTVTFDLAPPLRTAGPAALDKRELEGWSGLPGGGRSAMSSGISAW